MTGPPTFKSAAQEKAWAWAIKHPEQVTNQALADAGGVSSAGTAAGWLRAWRAELGDDLFRGEAADARAERTEAARAELEARKAEVRSTTVHNIGVSINSINQRIIDLVPSVASVRIDRGTDGQLDPVVVHGPDARQVKDLAWALGSLVRSLELMEGRPTNHTRRSVPGDQFVAPALGQGQADLTRDQKVATVLDIRERLLQRQSG